MCCYRSRLISVLAFKNDIEQDSVAIHLRYGGIFSDSIITKVITNVLLIQTVKLV